MTGDRRSHFRPHPAGALDSAQSQTLAAILGSTDVIVIGKNLDGIVTGWNAGAERALGYNAEEIIGRSIEAIAPPARPYEMREILVRIRRGEVIQQMETERRHKDGHLIHILLNVSPMHDTEGRVVGATKLALDITEARRNQRLIEEREARLRSILETAPDAVITIDADGLIQSFSHAAEKLFGYRAGEVIGQNVRMLMPSPYQHEHDSYVSRYLATGEKHIIGIGRQVEAKRKDGSVFPMELAVGEVKLGDGRLFTGFVRDISVRARLEQELRQSQKMEAIGQLTGGVAHDFNNLLTVISGNLEMLESRMRNPESREMLKEAQEATQLGAQLANRLLAFGRRQPLRPRAVDLNALVAGMTDLLRRTLGATIEIQTRQAPSLPATLLDPGGVENALLNLAINARDAMPGGGILTIETEIVTISDEDGRNHPELMPGSYVTLAVTDTGIGMTPEVREHAFEPFFTTKGPGMGSGLGLAMIYGFVKQSGGHVLLDSEVGSGTIARLYLPIHQPAAAPAGEKHGTARIEATGETILVVEDDPRVRLVSVRRLQALGYKVVEADSGPAALAILVDGAHFDLLFTDVIMAGGMTGIELAEAVRKQRPGLKILFTSGYAEPAIIQQGSLTADAGWLGKPYDIKELSSRLRELLGS